MAIKERVPGRYDVELQGRHVKRVHDLPTATMLEQSGKRLLLLGKPIEAVIAELRGKPPSPTLDAVYADWHATLTVGDQTSYRYGINFARVPRRLRSKHIDTIGAADIRRAVSAMSDEYSPKSVSVSVAAMRAVLNYAVDAGMLDRSPATRIPNMPTLKREREPMVLTPAQHKAIVAATPERFRPMLAVWPLTGLRRGEMADLMWSDIVGDRLHVRRFKTDASVRYIDLTPDAVAWFAVQHQESGDFERVFPTSTGGPLGHSTLYKFCFDVLRAACGIDVNPHDMRHTFGSWLITAGYPLTYVQARMGHSSPQTTLNVYAKEVAESEKAGADKLAEWLSKED